MKIHHLFITDGRTRRVKSAKRLHHVATDRQIKSSRSPPVVPTTLQKSVPSFRRKLRGSSRRAGVSAFIFRILRRRRRRTGLRLAATASDIRHTLATHYSLDSVISVVVGVGGRGPFPDMHSHLHGGQEGVPFCHAFYSSFTFLTRDTNMSFSGVNVGVHMWAFLLSSEMGWQ